ncbi:MAG: MFS transporter [Paenibacillaceae bacterium]|nr:MFS transporter [Paenibacillaceae bacterium]
MKLAEEASGQRSIIVVSVVTAISLLGDSMLYVVLPIYWSQAGLTALWEVGIVLSVNRLVRLPLNPLIGWMYNRMSLRAGLLAATGLGACSTLGYGLFDGFAIWLLLRAVWGIAWSLLRMGGLLTAIGYSSDANRGHALGQLNGISRMGSLVGMLGGGILVSLIGLKAMSLVFGALTLIGFAVILLLPNGKKAAVAPAKWTFGEWAALMRTPAVVLVLAGGLAISLLLAVLNATLSLVVEANYGQEVDLFGILLGGAALSGGLLAARYASDFLLSSWFGRRSDWASGRFPLLVAALTVSGIGYALLPWRIPLPVWAIVVVLVMIAGTALVTVMDAVAADVAQSSVMIAVMTAYSVAADLGSALGPMLSLWAIESAGSPSAVYVCSAAMFLAIAWWFGRRRETFHKGKEERPWGRP